MDLSALQTLVVDNLRQDAAVRAEVAIVTAILVALWTSHKKKRRLRKAIKIEVEMTSRMHRHNYTDKTRSDLEGMIRSDPSYVVTIFSSRGHVIIGNLTDDIAYMHPLTARRVIMFEDRVRVIDNAVMFMKTSAFAALPIPKKINILAIPFDYQDELQGIATQLISEL